MSRRAFAGTLVAVGSILVPTAMLALAYRLDRTNLRCFGYWSDGQKSAYGWLLGASPFVASGLVIAAALVGGNSRWRYLVAGVLAACAFAVFGISALVVAYVECA